MLDGGDDEFGHLGSDAGYEPSRTKQMVYMSTMLEWAIILMMA